jgi:hypothetical protein
MHDLIGCKPVENTVEEDTWPAQESDEVAADDVTELLDSHG